MFRAQVDGLSEDFKMDTQRDIHARATDDLYDAGRILYCIQNSLNGSYTV